MIEFPRAAQRAVLRKPDPELFQRLAVLFAERWAFGNRRGKDAFVCAEDQDVRAPVYADGVRITDDNLVAGRGDMAYV